MGLLLAAVVLGLGTLWFGFVGARAHGVETGDGATPNSGHLGTRWFLLAAGMAVTALSVATIAVALPVDEADRQDRAASALLALEQAEDRTEKGEQTVLSRRGDLDALETELEAAEAKLTTPEIIRLSDEREVMAANAQQLFAATSDQRDDLLQVEGVVETEDGPMTLAANPTSDGWTVTSDGQTSDLQIVFDANGALVWQVDSTQYFPFPGDSIFGTAAYTLLGPPSEQLQRSLNELQALTASMEDVREQITALERQLDPEAMAEVSGIRRSIATAERELESAESDLDGVRSAERGASTRFELADQRSRDSNDWMITAGSIALLLSSLALAGIWRRVPMTILVGLLTLLAALALVAAPRLDTQPEATAAFHRLALIALGGSYLLGLRFVADRPTWRRSGPSMSPSPAADLLKVVAVFLLLLLVTSFANLTSSLIGVNDSWVRIFAVAPVALLSIAIFLLSGVPVARFALRLSRWDYGNHVAPWMLRLADRHPRVAALWLLSSPWHLLFLLLTPFLFLASTGSLGDSTASDLLGFDFGREWFSQYLPTAFGSLVVLWLLSLVFGSLHRQALRWWTALWQPKISRRTRWSSLVDKTSPAELRNSGRIRAIVAEALGSDVATNRWWIGLINPTLEALAVPSDRPLLVIGPTGSGKTTSIVLQNAMIHSGPIVITSTKDELLVQLSGGFLNEDRRCYVFDPLQTLTSVPPGVERVSWNPLSGCDDWERARKRARLMVAAASSAGSHSADANSDFWEATAADTLAALLFGCAMTRRSLVDLLDIVSTLGDPGTDDPGADPETTRTGFSRLGDDLAVALGSPRFEYWHDELRLCLSALDQLYQISASGGTTASSLQLSVSRALSALRSVTALRVLMDDSSSIDVERVVQQSDVIFLVSETEDQTLTAPLFVGFVDEVVRRTYAHNRSADEPVETLLLLDELAQLAPLKNLPALVAEGRGKGLRILAVLQDLAQASAVWGEQGRAFPTKFPYLLVLPGLRDKQFLENLELLAGRYDHRYTTTSYTKASGLGLGRLGPSGSISRSRSVTENQERRSTLEASAIASMPAGRALLFATDVGLDRGWSEVWLTPTFTQEPFGQPFGAFLNQAVSEPAVLDLTESATSSSVPPTR